MVGNAKAWLPELLERASKLNVNNGFEQGADVSVVFSRFWEEFARSIACSSGVLLFLQLPSLG